MLAMMVMTLTMPIPLYQRQHKFLHELCVMKILIKMSLMVILVMLQIGNAECMMMILIMTKLTGARKKTYKLQGKKKTYRGEHELVHTRSFTHTHFVHPAYMYNDICIYM